MQIWPIVQVNVLPLCRVPNTDEDIYFTCKILISKFQKNVSSPIPWIDSRIPRNPGKTPVLHVHTYLQKMSEEIQQSFYFLTVPTKILCERIWLSIMGNFHDLNLLSMMREISPSFFFKIYRLYLQSTFVSLYLNFSIQNEFFVYHL